MPGCLLQQLVVPNLTVKEIEDKWGWRSFSKNDGISLSVMQWEVKKQLSVMWWEVKKQIWGWTDGHLGYAGQAFSKTVVCDNLEGRACVSWIYSSREEVWKRNINNTCVSDYSWVQLGKYYKGVKSEKNRPVGMLTRRGIVQKCGALPS